METQSIFGNIAIERKFQKSLWKGRVLKMIKGKTIGMKMQRNYESLEGNKIKCN